MLRTKKFTVLNLRVNTHLTKGTSTLLYFFCFFLHMRTLSVLDKYRAIVLGPCRAGAITLFTVFPSRVTYGKLAYNLHIITRYVASDMGMIWFFLPNLIFSVNSCDASYYWMIFSSFTSQSSEVFMPLINALTNYSKLWAQYHITNTAQHFRWIQYKANYKLTLLKS